MPRRKTRYVPLRRKAEQRTDYRNRLALIRSGLPKISVRRSNKYISGQIIEYRPDGDAVLCSVHSRELVPLGWKHSCKSIPASYLSGLLLGSKAKKAKIGEAVLDIGFHASIPGSRIYAFLKGCSDAGINVPHSEDILPADERISGAHIGEDVAKEMEAVKSSMGKASPKGKVKK